MGNSPYQLPLEQRTVTRIREGKIVTESLLEAITDLQSLAARFGDPSRSLADELIAERRAARGE